MKYKGNLAILLVLSMILPTCSGGGDDENTPAPTEPTISSLSANSAMPTNLLKVVGGGFDPKAKLTVSFFDNNGFKLNIPVIEATSTSLLVSVPPYIIPSTGIFGTGVVAIQVIQDSGSSMKVSNTVQNFQIQDLPTPLSPPGAVTLNILSANIACNIQLQKSIKGTRLDLPGLNAALAKNIANLQTLSSQIQSIYKKPSKHFSLGSIKGTEILINEKTLRESDRMVLAMVRTLRSASGTNSINSNCAPQMQEISPPTAIGCGQQIYAMDMRLSSQDVGGRPTDSTTCQNGIQCLSNSISDSVKISNQIIAGAATVALGALGLMGAPAIALALPAAALIYVGVTSIGTQVVTSAALKNSNEAESYKALHQAVDETESLVRDFLIGSVLSETAGNIYNLIAGSLSLHEGFLDTSSITPPPAPARSTYTGSISHSESTTECIVSRAEFNATISITVSGSGTATDPYSGSIIFEGILNTTIISCCKAPCPSSGEFTLSGNGIVSGSQGTVLSSTFPVGGPGYSATFTNGTINGNYLMGTLTLVLEGYPVPPGIFNVTLTKM